MPFFVDRGGAMLYYTTWIMGSAALFTAFLTTYCVGNLIGSALAKPLTDWKCKVSVFWWTNALLAVSLSSSLAYCTSW